jgi:hypothetical protein
MTTANDISSELNRACWSCSREIAMNDKFCRHCGAGSVDGVEGGVIETSPPIPEWSEPPKDPVDDEHRPEVFPEDAGDAKATREQLIARGEQHPFIIKTEPRVFWVLGVVIVVAAGIGITDYLIKTESNPLTTGSIPQNTARPELRVGTFKRELRVTNVGKRDLEIVDITINEDDDCTTSTIEAVSSDNVFYYLKIPLTAPNIDKTIRHEAWFEGQGYYFGDTFRVATNGEYRAEICARPGSAACLGWENVGISVVLSHKGLLLRAGESNTWRESCDESITHATVQTNLGTGR